MRKAVIAAAVIVFTLTAAVYLRLAAFDMPREAQQVPLTLKQGDHQLSGTLLLPKGVTSPPVVLLVHGDAAQDRWSDGGYLPLVNTLIEHGIAVVSWDKPGVGASTGNWLAQTMDDRAQEAASVMRYLRQQPKLAHSRMGFFGFSQAGWVVPRASQRSAADFIVLVGPAINWREQGSYFLRQRLLQEQRPAAEIARAVARDAAEFATEFSVYSVARPCQATCDRADFERRNALSDVRADIAVVNTPVMILMGEQDRNVDPHQTLSEWQQRLPPTTPHCLRLVKGATHGLLRSRWYDYQLLSEWPLWKQGLFLLSGSEAYTPGTIERVVGWINDGRCLP